VAIESEELRKKITEDIKRWCDQVKATPLLRQGDIEGLVRTILEEFYHIHLTCGHMVKELDEGINLEIDDSEGKEYGFYCRDCAEKFIKAGFASSLKRD